MPAERSRPDASETVDRINAIAVSRPDPEVLGFDHGFATVDGVRLHYVRGGKPDGEVVVLLAGFPESWFAWRKVLPLLAPTYHLIAPDLPGQGDSDHPQDGYDTQTLATMIHRFLKQLGISRYCLAAHDIGAWVAFPFALMFASEIRRLILFDAGIPGITLPEALPTSPERAWRTWHFPFHALPDLPEILIGGRERAYLEWFLRRKAANPETFSDRDVDEYVRILTKDGGLRAGLAYYRAATLSAEQNRDLSRQTRLPMPVLAVGSDQGSIADMATPLRPFAVDLHGSVMENCGHFIPEEQPVAVARVLTAFLTAPSV